MRKICCHIQKGGVGKTSVSGTIAAGLARAGKRTVYVDCDPQGNASSWYCSQSVDYDLADVLANRVPLAQVIQSIGANLDMIPVAAIDGSLKEWAETKLAQSPLAFIFLADDLAGLGYEYAIFDCSPSFSMLERAVIAAVDEVINPLSPEFFSVDGIEIFANELRKVETAYRRTVCNDKIVLNMVNHSYARHREFEKALQRTRYQVYEIPQDAKLAECQIAHKSLYDFAPHAKSIAPFAALTSALLSETAETIVSVGG